MSCRINQVNKKTGVTYVYESVSYWDKEKKQARNKKTCIGRLDANETFVPSTRLAPEQAAVRDPIVTASAEIVGSSIILDTITDMLGLKSLLKSSFPGEYRQILTMAYYLVSQGGPLSHCGTWCKSHAHPFGATLTSQCITEILRAISVDKKQTFFTKWMDKVSEDDYLCYDITSISSYSALNEYIKYGHNRDLDKLPQLNLAILFSQKGRLPVYFERTPGNITDVTTLHNLLKTFKAMETKTLHYVMDKGFYSKKNVDELLASKDKFMLLMTSMRSSTGLKDTKSLMTRSFMSTLACTPGERTIVAATYISITTRLRGLMPSISLARNWLGTRRSWNQENQ